MENISDCTLLVVDDEVILRTVLVKKIESLGPTVISASDGKAALEILQTCKIDAVLTDLDMPIMNGLQLLTQMRESGLLTPVIILTGHGDQDSIRSALRLGAIDFLDKPFDSEMLSDVIRKALRLGRAIKLMDTSVASGKKSVSPKDIRIWKEALLSANTKKVKSSA